MYSLLETAISHNDISIYIDWDTLSTQLPLLPLDSLTYALTMLGYSKHITHISVLKPYLDYNHLPVQTNALDAIITLWWHASGQDPQVKTIMKLDALRHIDFLIGNPQKHNIPTSQIRELFQKTCKETINNMEQWFEKHEKR